MATITTQDSSLSFLTNTLGGFSSTAAAKMPVLGDRLEGFVENLYAAVAYGYPDYVSNSRVVLETFYPTYGYVTINGSGLTGNSPTITRMAFDGGRLLDGAEWEHPGFCLWQCLGFALPHQRQ